MNPFKKFFSGILFLAVLASTTSCIRHSQTETPDKERSLIPCDQNVHPSAQRLADYLQQVSNQKKTIFGHQGDLYLQIPENTLSTTDNLTGDISGIFGIDTMVLTGAEVGIPDPDTALKYACELSLKAADRGAIITLSAHMPNFASPNICPHPDIPQSMSFGQADSVKLRPTRDNCTDESCLFSYYTLADVRDLSGGCISDVLPDGAFHNVFCSYLDIIAQYGLFLQERNIPVLFRPFHEGNGDWFWWGTNNSPAEYQRLYQFTVGYLRQKGVHNFLYVYSVNSPVDESQLSERYPGDAYVDIISVDQYDPYLTYPADFKEDFFLSLEQNCQALLTFADTHQKLTAISETGLWIMKEDGSDHEGLLEKDNPVKNKDWYNRVGKLAVKYHMPYFLLWVSESPRNTHLPYEYKNSFRHEMVDDFLHFYQQDYSIFAGDTHFYD